MDLPRITRAEVRRPDRTRTSVAPADRRGTPGRRGTCRRHAPGGPAFYGETCMKRKTLTVGLCSVHRQPGWSYSGEDQDTVPMVRLRGDWLKREGFEKGKKMTVDAVLGTLSLTLIGRVPKAKYSVREAQEILHMLVQRLREVVRGLGEVHDGLPAPRLHDGSLEEELAPDLAAEILGAIE